VTPRLGILGAEQWEQTVADRMQKRKLTKPCC